MLFIISFTLSLLTVVAGLFLLMRSKQEIKFFRIMSWIITSLGMLAFLMSVHMAVFKMVMHHHERSGKENMFFKKFTDEKSEKFCKENEEEDEDACCDLTGKEAGMKVIAIDKEIAGAIAPEEQSKLILKIVSDNVKLTADQEKKIKTAIEESLEKVKEIIPKVNEEVKVEKK